MNKSSKVLFIKCGKTLPEEVLLAFKAECSRRGKSMTHMLSRFIKTWLEEIKTR